MLRHVVLFALKETATPTQLQAIEQAFAALPPQIAEIKDFEWGTDVSVEHLADGYTRCFLVTFASLGHRHGRSEASAAGIPNRSQAAQVAVLAHRGCGNQSTR